MRVPSSIAPAEKVRSISAKAARSLGGGEESVARKSPRPREGQVFHGGLKRYGAESNAVLMPISAGSQNIRLLTVFRVGLS